MLTVDHFLYSYIFKLKLTLRSWMITNPINLIVNNKNSIKLIYTKSLILIYYKYKNLYFFGLEYKNLYY